MSQFSRLVKEFKKQLQNSAADEMTLEIKRGAKNDKTIWMMKKTDGEKTGLFKKEAWRITSRLEAHTGPGGKPLEKPITTPASVAMHGFGGAFSAAFSRRAAIKIMAEEAAKASLEEKFIKLAC